LFIDYNFVYLQKIYRNMLQGLLILYFFYRIFLCKNKGFGNYYPVYPWEMPLNVSAPKVSKPAGISVKNLLGFIVLSIAAAIGFIVRLFKKTQIKH
jgi:hypothetical protein